MADKPTALPIMPAESPLAEKLRDELTQIHRFSPRPEQVEAIKTLAIDQKDLILIARTGWGKSMVFQSIPALRKGGIALMLMPLNMLEEDQADSIRKIPGCVPCILNSQSNTAGLRKQIVNGEFTHVLMGPEIALSDKFAELLECRKFQQRLVLVAIDEVHVVKQWGEDWRKHYSRVGVLRHRIDKRIPWFGTSATLDPALLKDVIEIAGFPTNVKVMKTTIDRPDISLSIRRIEHSLTSFHDLSFLIEDAMIHDGSVNVARIPKTVVYMDSIAQIEAAEHWMIEWLVRIGCHRASASTTIQAYHSQLAEFDKRSISDNYRRPDGADTLPATHRIILATDAMGMGINNPDIRRVIQWRQPSSMCMLLQRAGRAARGRDHTGEFLWLVDPWCFGPRDVPENMSRRAKQDMERRAHLDPALWELINTSGCIRRCVLDFFGESRINHQPQDLAPCCSNCNGTDILPKPRIQIQPPRKSKVPNWARQRTITDLTHWRRMKSQELFQNSFFQIKDAEEAVMPTCLLESLAKEGYHIHTMDDLRLRTEGKWTWLLRFGDEVLEIIRAAANISGVDIRAIGEARAAKKGKQRHPLQQLDANANLTSPPSDPFITTMVNKRQRIL